MQTWLYGNKKGLFSQRYTFSTLWVFTATVLGTTMCVWPKTNCSAVCVFMFAGEHQTNISEDELSSGDLTHAASRSGCRRTVIPEDFWRRCISCRSPLLVHTKARWRADVFRFCFFFLPFCLFYGPTVRASRDVWGSWRRSGSHWLVLNN